MTWYIVLCEDSLLIFVVVDGVDDAVFGGVDGEFVFFCLFSLYVF